MTKIGRNDPCPCGSGKKYKKCCLGKEVPKQNIFGNKNIGIVEFHNYHVKTREVKPESKSIDEKLIHIYSNRDKMSTREIIDDYLIILNFILDYAKKHNIKEIKKLDEEGLVGEFIGNVINDFDYEVSNLQKNEYDLEVIFEYLDKLANTIDLDKNRYESTIRQKTSILFKLDRVDEGEKILVDYLKKSPKSVYIYVELVDDFRWIGNLEKAKYYYDLGLSYKDLEDRDILEERSDYFD